MDYRNHTILKLRLPRLFLFIMLTATAPVQGAESLGERLRGLFDGDESASGRETILSADKAFRFTASVAGPDRLQLFWQIADGYYLYRDKFNFSILKGDASIESEAIVIPHGIIKEDENFGSVEINTGEVTVEIPLQRRDKHQETPIVLHVAYQGCKEDSVCYPPVKRDIDLTLTASTGE